MGAASSVTQTLPFEFQKALKNMRALCHCCVFLSSQGFLHESATNPAFSFSREPAEKQVIVIREGELSWESDLPAYAMAFKAHSLQGLIRSCKKAFRLYLDMPPSTSPSSANKLPHIRKPKNVPLFLESL